MTPMQRQADILAYLRKAAEEDGLQSIKIDYKEKRDGQIELDVRTKERP